LIGADKNTVRQLIDQGYSVNFFADSLPALTRNVGGEFSYRYGFPVGFSFRGKYHIYNHLIFKFYYHPAQLDPDGGQTIVGFEVVPVSNNAFSKDSMPEGFCPDGEMFDLDEHEDITYTYDVVWFQSPVPWASRWDKYHEMAGTQSTIGKAAAAGEEKLRDYVENHPDEITDLSERLVQRIVAPAPAAAPAYVPPPLPPMPGTHAGEAKEHFDTGVAAGGIGVGAFAFATVFLSALLFCVLVGVSIGFCFARKFVRNNQSRNWSPPLLAQASAFPTVQGQFVTAGGSQELPLVAPRS